MALYFVSQNTIQNYLTDSNTEVVSLKKETSEDSEKKDTIEELKEDFKKIHTQFVYTILPQKIDDNFTYHAEKMSMTLSFDVLIPPPEQI